MPDQILPPIPISDRFALPCLRLIRVFRIATDFRKLFLGGIALLLLAAGQVAFSYLPFAPPSDPTSAPHSAVVWKNEFDFGRQTWLGTPPLTILSNLTRPTPELLAEQMLRWDVLLAPLQTVYEPAARLVQPGLGWSSAAWNLTQLLWALSIWAIFGGAICRMAAVQFARDEKLSAFAALKFSCAKFVSCLCSPLLPLTGVGILGGLCGLGGALGRIPDAGPVIVACAWGLALALAFLMTLMLLGTAVGWPLMISAISTEASDAFDGFSRAYSFVFSRPWHYAGYVLFSLVYGSLTLVFLSIVASMVALLAAWGVGLGMGSAGVAELYSTAPPLLGGPSLAGDGSVDSLSVATHLTGGWLFVLSLLLTGFIVSFFWTASTIIYFLLRNVDDATGFDEVWLPEPDEQDELLPLAGVAASEQPVIERPARAPEPNEATRG